MDWFRVLGSPSLLDKDWYKDVRGPPIIELENYKGLMIRPPTIRSVLTYECVNCSRPVFANYYGKKMSDGEFGAVVEEELLIFMKSCGVVISTECVSFNGNMFYAVTCQCEEELGYFILEMRNVDLKGLHETFWVRGERVRSRDSSREMKLMEFVNNKARLVLSQLQKKRLPSGELKSILTPEFMAVAGSAAVDVANHLLGNDVEDSLVPPFNHFLAEEPERLGDKQFVVQDPKEPDETHSTMLLMCLGSILEDKS